MLRNSIADQLNYPAAKLYLVSGVILLFWAVVCAYIPWYQSLLLMTIFVSGVVLMIRPEAAAYILAVMTPLFGNRLAFYFDFTGIGARTSKTIPFYLIFLVLGIVAWFLKKTSHLDESRPYRNPLPLPIVLLFVLYAYMSLSWAPYYEYSRVVFFFVIMNFAIYYFIPSVVVDERTHRRFMMSWVVAGIVISVLTLLSFDNIPEKEFFTKRISYWATLIFNTTTEIKYRGHGIGHPNNTSLTLNMALFISIGLFVAEKAMKRRVLIGAATLFLLFGNLLTASKGGIGSLLLGFYFFCFFSSLIRKRLAKFMVAAHLVVVLLLSMSILYTSFERTPRLLKTSYRGKTVSLDNRYEMWDAGLAQLKRKNLTMTGLAPGGFEVSTEYPHAHSHIFSFYFDYGIAGMLFALIMYALFLYTFWKFLMKNRTQDTYAQIMCLALISGLVAIAIHGTIDHNYTKSVIWLFLASTVATLRLRERETLPQENG